MIEMWSFCFFFLRVSHLHCLSFNSLFICTLLWMAPSTKTLANPQEINPHYENAWQKQNLKSPLEMSPETSPHRPKDKSFSSCAEASSFICSMRLCWVSKTCTFGVRRCLPRWKAAVSKASLVKQTKVDPTVFKLAAKYIVNLIKF